MSDYEQYKSLCQVCGKPAVTEIGKNAHPNLQHYRDWVAFCRKCRNDYLNGVKLEVGPRLRMKIR